jgi:transposase
LLYAALDVKTGKMTGKTAQRHTRADFIAFLAGVVQQTKWSSDIHIVLDNLSAHKTKAVEEFQQQNSRSTCQLDGIGAAVARSLSGRSHCVIDVFRDIS